MLVHAGQAANQVLALGTADTVLARADVTGWTAVLTLNSS
jgi:hypothetical protein